MGSTSLPRYCAAMSQENIEIVRSIVAGWARGDYTSIDWADPEIEYAAPDTPVATRGVEALGRRWKEFLLAWERFATTPERFIDAGDDRVLVLVRFDGRGRASSIPAAEFFGAQLFTLREGKVVRLAVFLDRQAALEAAGLRENVAVVRAIFEAGARGDAATVLDLYDPQIECDASRSPLPRLIGGDGFTGHDGLRRFFRERAEAWEQVEDEYEELIECEGQVVSVNTVRARGGASGIDVSISMAGVWTVRDRKVVRVAWFATREEALEAAAAGS